MTRRNFITTAATLVAARRWTAIGGPEAGLNACVIGHTGRGDYGHGLDIALTDVPGVTVLAVADPNEAGRTAARGKAKAARSYADWREMLNEEKPNLVCLASRWSEHRHEQALASIALGAHLFSEKPFTRTLAEADEILRRASEKNLRIAVAHQIRLSPATLKLKQALDAGLIGELVQIQLWGKQDSRAGGEDMLVLGSHLFDLLRFFAGDAQSCHTRVLHDGRDITKSDARTVTEQIGPVAGNSILAQFAFANGVNATFTSDQRLRDTFGPWSIRLIGSKGSVHFLVEIDPSIYISKPGKWNPDGRADEWVRWPEDPNRGLPSSERGFPSANRRVVNDLLASIKDGRTPVCSGHAATQSLEMIMAVYQSALTRERVSLPLQERRHPLG